MKKSQFEIEEQLRLGVEVAGIGLGSIDYIANLITLDSIAAALFGLPANVPIPRSNIHARFHPEDVADIFAKMAKALDPSGSGFMAYEHRILRPDGSMRWVSARKQVQFAATHSGDPKRAKSGLIAMLDISERKSAEERVALSEIRYRRLFEAAKDGVLLLDPNSCKIIDANPFMTILLDYSREQLVGKELYEIGLLRDADASQAMVQKLKVDRQVRYENLPLESKAGQCKDVEVVANLYDEDGQSVIQCNIRDITERKRIEAALLQNETLFSTLVDQAPTGMYVIDGQFRMQQINALAIPAFKTVMPLLGRDFAEVLQIVWGTEVGNQIADIFRHTLKTGERYVSPPFSGRRQDVDETQSYEWEVQRITLPNEQLGVVCYFRDVSESMRTEAILGGSQARLRHAADAARLTYVAINFVEDRVTIPENFAAVMGYDPAREEGIDATAGKGMLLDHVLPSDRPLVEAALNAFFKVEHPGKIQYRVLGEDRIERWIETIWSGELALDGKPLTAFATNLDITEKKHSEEQIKLLMAEVNHRAKNLLAIVQAVAQQTARGGDPTTFVTRLSQRIQGLAASHDLLFLSEWSGVDVSDLVKTQLSYFKDIIGTRILVSGPELRLTPAAAQGIGMALHELATNAAKYGALSNDTGKVYISWSADNSEQPMFFMSWLEQDGPRVLPPHHKGFGQKVIGQMVEAAVDGTSKILYLETGLSWILKVNLTNILEKRPSNARASTLST